MISGEKFQQARLRMGLTVKDLAEQAGLNANTIRRLEEGIRVRLEDDTVIRLARVFGMDPTAFRKALESRQDLPVPKPTGKKPRAAATG